MENNWCNQILHLPWAAPFWCDCSCHFCWDHTMNHGQVTYHCRKMTFQSLASICDHFDPVFLLSLPLILNHFFPKNSHSVYSPWKSISLESENTEWHWAFALEFDISNCLTSRLFHCIIFSFPEHAVKSFTIPQSSLDYKKNQGQSPGVMQGQWEEDQQLFQKREHAGLGCTSLVPMTQSSSLASHSPLPTFSSSAPWPPVLPNAQAPSPLVKTGFG